VIAMSLEKYSGQLRALNEDYFCGHLTFEEYRKLRGDILVEIEDELNMSSGTQAGQENNALAGVLAYFNSTEASE
jgi:hypothetical protein